jgi:hypothetical protein
VGVAGSLSMFLGLVCKLFYKDALVLLYHHHGF